jgi:hypothetical protein
MRKQTVSRRKSGPESRSKLFMTHNIPPLLEHRKIVEIFANLIFESIEVPSNTDLERLITINPIDTMKEIDEIILKIRDLAFNVEIAFFRANGVTSLLQLRLAGTASIAVRSRVTTEMSVNWAPLVGVVCTGATHSVPGSSRQESLDQPRFR